MIMWVGKRSARVTRAWIRRRALGAGSVGIYIMCDNNANGGFQSALMVQQQRSLSSPCDWRSVARS